MRFPAATGNTAIVHFQVCIMNGSTFCVCVCVPLRPLILTVGELGPADCFLHPLQF